MRVPALLREVEERPPAPAETPASGEEVLAVQSVAARINVSGFKYKSGDNWFVGKAKYMSALTLPQARTKLRALRAIFPQGYYVHEKYVSEYNWVVDLLQDASGLDLSEYKVALTEMAPVSTSFVFGTPRHLGPETLSHDNYCERTVILPKLEKLISFVIKLPVHPQVHPQKTEYVPATGGFSKFRPSVAQPA